MLSPKLRLGSIPVLMFWLICYFEVKWRKISIRILFLWLYCYLEAKWRKLSIHTFILWSNYWFAAKLKKISSQICILWLTSYLEAKWANIGTLERLFFNLTATVKQHLQKVVTLSLNCDFEAHFSKVPKLLST